MGGGSSREVAKAAGFGKNGRRSRNMSRFRPPVFPALFCLAFAVHAAPVLPPWPLPFPQGPVETTRTARWTDEEFSCQIDLDRGLDGKELAAYSDALAADGWTRRNLAGRDAGSPGPDAARLFRELRLHGHRELADGLSEIVERGAVLWKKPPLTLVYLSGKNVLFCSFPFGKDFPAPASPPGGWLFGTPFALPGAKLSMRAVTRAADGITAMELWKAPPPGDGFLDRVRAQLVANGWQFVPPVGEAPLSAGKDTAAMDAALVHGIFAGTAMFRSASGEEAMLSVREGDASSVPASANCVFLLRFPAP